MTTQNLLTILDQQFVDRKLDFKAVLPNNVTVDKFIRIVKTAVIQTPDLLTADRASLFTACFKAAQDGLLPDGRESALVLYSTKQKDGTWKKLVQYMPMFSGILKKVRNSGELLTISANVVYANDSFDYELGDNEHIIHKPALSNRGNIIGVYGIAKTKDNAVYREVMSIEEIEKVKNASKSKDYGPWATWYEEMAKKTVIRRLSKRLPMNTDVEEVIYRDDNLYDLNIQTVKPIDSETKSNFEQAIQAHKVLHIENNNANQNDDFDINPEAIQKAETLNKE